MSASAAVCALFLSACDSLYFCCVVSVSCSDSSSLLLLLGGLIEGFNVGALAFAGLVPSSAGSVDSVPVGPLCKESSDPAAACRSAVRATSIWVALKHLREGAMRCSGPGWLTCSLSVAWASFFLGLFCTTT